MTEMQVMPTSRRETVVVEFTIAAPGDVEAIGSVGVMFEPRKGKATYQDGRLAFVQLGGDIRKTSGALGDRYLENNYTHRDLLRAAIRPTRSLPGWLPDVARALVNQDVAPVPSPA